MGGLHRWIGGTTNSYDVWIHMRFVDQSCNCGIQMVYSSDSEIDDLKVVKVGDDIAWSGSPIRRTRLNNIVPDLDSIVVGENMIVAQYMLVAVDFDEAP